MGIAERWLRANFSPEVCDHHTFVIAGDGCFEEGISHEAASLAGHLRLGRLVYVYDDNHITIDGPTELSYSDDVAGRFAAYGWAVDDIGEVADDLAALEAALVRARAEEDRPSLIILRSHIGYPSPHLTDTAKAHGDPFPEEEIRLTKGILGLPEDESFWVPDEVLGMYRRCIPRGQAWRSEWKGRFDAWSGDKDRWEAAQRGHGMPGWEAKLPTFMPEDGPMATRKAIKACLDATGDLIPGVIPGSADLTGNTGMAMADAVAQSAEEPGGDLIHFGIREHGMAGVMTGMAAHRGVVPVGGTFFVFSDYMRGAVRVAALSDVHVIYSWTHDSVGLGQDGPTHQPIEQLAAVRAMPDLRVIRPADANETAQAWRHRRRQRRPDGPHPQSPGDPGAGRDGGAGRERRAPGRLRAPGRRGRAAPGGAHRHRQRGARLPGRRRPAGFDRGGRQGRVVPLVGAVRRPARPVPGRGAPRRGPPPGGGGGQLVRLGAVRRRHRLHRPLRGLGSGGRGPRGVRLHRARTWRPERPHCSSPRPDDRAGPPKGLSMSLLDDLYDQQGQSPWLDNLRRDWLRDGTMAGLVAQGIRGVTSNPTILAKAIAGQDTYDEQFGELIKTKSVEDAYWDLVVEDIEGALALLRPVFDSSQGGDGFVSIEVAPALAHDTDGTVEAARDLHVRIDQPNVLVKIPATAEGVPAIRQMISEGRSINVTLIFSIARYDEVIEAYLSGLEALAASGSRDLSQVASVASFFVSRVDTEVDRRIEAAGPSAADGNELPTLRGQAAVAQARLAYRLFTERFSGPRWEALAAKGARVQRPLWASTSTKNPAYPDLAYVDTLIGPETVNTMPEGTVADFLDHGTVARTVDTGVDAARSRDRGLAAAGIDMEDVARVLEAEGVASFAKSFDELMQSLSDKANALNVAGRPGPAAVDRATRAGPRIPPCGDEPRPVEVRAPHRPPHRGVRDEDRHGRPGQDGRQHDPAPHRARPPGRRLRPLGEGPVGGGRHRSRAGRHPRGGGRPSCPRPGWRG